jgi:hypothetical protein
MTRVLLTFLLVLFFALPLFAQSVDTAWVRRYNGQGNSYDAAKAIVVDNRSNVYVTGSSGTIKYSSDGELLWIGSFGGVAIAVDSASNVYVTEGSNDDYVTVKYYPNGDTAWLRTYNGPGNGTDDAYAIATDSSGNVYVTGLSMGSGTSSDYATVKYYPNGDTAWVRRYDGPVNGWDKASAIAVDGSGNVYVTGSSDEEYEELIREHYATIKYYPNGDTAWVRRSWFSWRGDKANDLTVDNSGNVYVTGTSSLNMRNSVYASIKYDVNGDGLWGRIYGWCDCEAYNEAYAIAADNSGNAYVTGMSTSSGGGATIKYYSNGDTAWVRRDSNGTAIDIVVDVFGNAYVTGSSYSGGTSCDFATIKYYTNGDSAWVRRYNGPESLSDYGNAIAIDGSDNVYVTGESYGSGTGMDYVTIKYVQFLRGDANNDEKVTVSDVVYLINYLFKGGPTPNPLQSGDANCDGQVTVSDVVYLINYLFKGGPPPAC